MSTDSAANDIGCDEYGYPVRATLEAQIAALKAALLAATEAHRAAIELAFKRCGSRNSGWG